MDFCHLRAKLNGLTITTGIGFFPVRIASGAWHTFADLGYTYKRDESLFSWRLAWHGATKSSPTERAR